MTGDNQEGQETQTKVNPKPQTVKRVDDGNFVSNWFLSTVKGKSVRLELSNGNTYHGVLLSFDRYCLSINFNSETQLFFKSGLVRISLSSSEKPPTQRTPHAQNTPHINKQNITPR